MNHEGNRPAMPPNLPWSLMKNQEQLPLKILIDHLARNNYGVLTIKIVTNICQMQVDYVRLKIADPHSSHRVDPIVQQKLVPATPAQNSTPALSMEVEHNYISIYLSKYMMFLFLYIYINIQELRKDTNNCPFARFPPLGRICCEGPGNCHFLPTVVSFFLTRSFVYFRMDKLKIWSEI